eukprot:2864276-Amphidinium_carterae.1
MVEKRVIACDFRHVVGLEKSASLPLASQMQTVCSFQQSAEHTVRSKWPLNPIATACITLVLICFDARVLVAGLSAGLPGTK